MLMMAKNISDIHGRESNALRLRNKSAEAVSTAVSGSSEMSRPQRSNKAIHLCYMIMKYQNGVNKRN